MRRARSFRRQSAARSLFGLLAALAVCSGTIRGADATRAVHLRFEWGTVQPRLWTGVLELSSGRFAAVESLGIEADEPGTLWIDGRAVWLQRRGLRAYDGFDVALAAPGTARLVLTLQSGPAAPLRKQIELTVADLLVSDRVVPLDEQGGRLVVRRTPGDAMPILFDRPHLVFRPREIFAAHVRIETRTEDPRRGTLAWRLTPGRRTTVVDSGTIPLHDVAAQATAESDPNADDERGTVRVPLSIRLPDSEGVYDLHCEWKHRGGVVESSMLQLVVVADEEPTEPVAHEDDGTPGSGASRLLRLLPRGAKDDADRHGDDVRLGAQSRLVDGFRPVEPEGWRLLGASPRSGRVGDLAEKWRTFGERFEPAWKAPWRDKGDDDPKRPRAASSGIGVRDPSGVTWSAFRLKVEHPGRPHRLAVTCRGRDGSVAGVSLVEPNASGQLMPIGLDLGFAIGSDEIAGSAERADGTQRGANGRGAAIVSTVRQVVCWPKGHDPVLLLHDFGRQDAAIVERVELHELGDLPPWTADAAPGAEPAAASGRHRRAGAALQKPLLPENFGAAEAFDAASRRSLDDWVTFHEAGTRLTKLLRFQGRDSLLLAVAADGSSVYPSRLLHPTPRYDTGTYFSTGQDPVRKDALELLLRLFARQDLGLYAELQFATPLPELERRLARDGADAHGIELLDRSGRTWSEAAPQARGVGPHYNPLDPRVQEAVLAVVRELVERYKDHAALKGVAVSLGSDGYLQFPGLDWGYDDATIARFEQATGIRLPATTGAERFAARHELLVGRHAAVWTRWRCEELSRFHRRLADAVVQARPDLEFLLAGRNSAVDGGPDDRLGDLTRSGGRPAAVLATRGLDFSWTTSTERTFVLPAVSETPLGSRLERALDLAVDEHPGRNAAYEPIPSGAVLRQVPREVRLASFDPLSPWQPAFTWLAANGADSGSTVRSGIVRNLAAHDARRIFDGGWLVSTSIGGDAARTCAAFRSLPDVPLPRLTLSGGPTPIVVRSGEDDSRPVVCLANESAGPVTIVLHAEAKTGTGMRPRGGSAPARWEWLASDRATLTVTLEPSGLWVGEFDRGPVRFVSHQTRLDPDTLRATERSLAAWRTRLQEVHRAERSRTAHLVTGDPIVLVGAQQAADVPAEPAPGSEVVVAGHWEDAAPETDGSAGRVVLAGPGQTAAFASPQLTVGGARELRIATRIKGDRDGRRVRFHVETTAGTHRRTHLADVTAGSEWEVRHVRIESPLGREIDSVRVRVELLDAGRLHVDGVTLRTVQVTDDELRELTKAYLAASQAWTEGRQSECERILRGYWGQRLTETPAAAVTPIPAPSTKP